MSDCKNGAVRSAHGVRPYCDCARIDDQCDACAARLGPHIARLFRAWDARTEAVNQLWSALRSVAWWETHTRPGFDRDKELARYRERAQSLTEMLVKMDSEVAEALAEVRR